MSYLGMGEDAATSLSPSCIELCNRTNPNHADDASCDTNCAGWREYFASMPQVLTTCPTGQMATPDVDGVWGCQPIAPGPLVLPGGTPTPAPTPKTVVYPTPTPVLPAAPPEPQKAGMGPIGWALILGAGILLASTFMPVGHGRIGEGALRKYRRNPKRRGPAKRKASKMSRRARSQHCERIEAWAARTCGKAW